MPVMRTDNEQICFSVLGYSFFRSKYFLCPENNDWNWYTFHCFKLWILDLIETGLFIFLKNQLVSHKLFNLVIPFLPVSFLNLNFSLISITIPDRYFFVLCATVTKLSEDLFKEDKSISLKHVKKSRR